MHAALVFFRTAASTCSDAFSLPDALPILLSADFTMAAALFEKKAAASPEVAWKAAAAKILAAQWPKAVEAFAKSLPRSEEHTSELQSPVHLVCCLLLEKKKCRVFSTTGSH